MGSTSGIGLIPNNRTARNLLQLLNHPTIEKRLINKDYEAVGMIPVGTANMVMKTKKYQKWHSLEVKELEFWPITRHNKLW